MTEHWITQQWYKSENCRYYRVELHQDLWGNWFLTRTWGSKTKLGRQVSESIASIEEGQQKLAQISQVRRTKRYQPVPKVSP